MFKQDEDKIEFELGTRSFGFLAGQESFFISYVEIFGVYLSLALGTAKFKQLD